MSSISGGWAMQISLQKHNFKTLSTELGETGSYFMEKAYYC